VNRLLLLLGILAAGLPGGCQSAQDVVAEESEPHDFRLVFRHGSYVKKAASFHAVITVEGGREIWLNLDAPNGELAASAANRWAEALNARQPGLAEASSNTVVLRRVLRIETRGALRGLKLRDLGESL